MAATPTVSAIDTEHSDMIHDAQMDYYGKRLATCASDRTVRIFDVAEDGQHKLVKELRGHEGPVWMVGWSHPNFGNLLASCSHDRKVLIWKETAVGWEQTKEHIDHDGSVNAVAWAPDAMGCAVLACASADGDISILTLTKENRWSVDRIRGAHRNGVTAVSWAPMLAIGSLGSSEIEAADKTAAPRLVSCGCDKHVKIWTRIGDTWSANPVVLDGHDEWVRDVAWAPGIGLSCSTIASCSQDGTVLIWTQQADGFSSEREDSTAWVCTTLRKFTEPVWRVSWSLTGNMLAVSSAESKVTLWKEALDGVWTQIGDLEGSGGTN